MSTMTEHSTELATVGSAGREGGRGPSALSPGQRWSVARKREVVLRLLRGEAAEDLSRELAVPVYRLERWRERALAGIEGALKEREGDPLKDELGAAMRRLGELTMENELLRARAERPGPLARRRSR
jgi:transposase